MRREAILMASATLLALPTALAHAQNVGVNIQQFNPDSADTLNYVHVSGAGVLGHLQPSFGAYFNYGYRPLVIRSGDDWYADLLLHQAQLDLLGALGIGNRLQLGFALPVTVFQAEGTSHGNDNFSVPDVASTALGDVRLVPRLRLVGGGDSMVGLGLEGVLTLPTGNDDAYQGNGTLTFEPRAMLDLRPSERLRAGLNLGYILRSDRSIYNTNIGNELTFGAGLSYAVNPDSLTLIAELLGRLPVDGESEIKGGVIPLAAHLAARFALAEGHALTLGGGPALPPSGYGTPLVRAFLGYSVTPPLDAAPKDRDNDGIPDASDTCPTDPEDIDGFEDANGCPDPDNDGDGIPDGSDKCPNDAEDLDGYEDGDGCADPDNDGDGVLDAKDTCPTELEDRDGFKDEDGCPDPDNDGDGILDASDRCPGQAEDMDNLVDEDGCPELDADKDGIPDTEDKCQLEPETINGNQDDDGCPDKGESKVQMTADAIVILDKVYFDTNKDTIQRRSFSILRQVASVLRANPQITKLRIEGHTDDVGNDAANLDLSQRRANAVLTFLVEAKIESTRLEAVGYGESKPIAENKTEKGRALNRRVVFSIIEVDGKPVAPTTEAADPGRVVPDEVKKEEAAPQTP